MAAFFPQVTGTFKYEESRALRRFSMSVVEMAIVTGVLLRVYRATALSVAPSGGIALLAVSFGLGVLLFCGAVTLHLGNYTPKRWLWRAPVFGAIEAGAESLTSLLLIALHREPLGSARAVFGDWPAMALDTFFWRLLAVVLFASALAGVVQLVRYVLEKRGEVAEQE